MRTNLFSGSMRASTANASIWIYTLGALVPVVWLLFQGQFSLLAFGFLLLPLVIAILIDKPTSICLILAYLFLVGDIRRMVGMFIGFPKFDPLLLVGPFATILLALPLLLRLRVKDPISKTVLALLAVMGLQIVNPRQGPISVGLAGALFYIIPLLWFWIGRRFGTDQLVTTVIYRVLIPLAILASLVGLCQTYIGFLPWQTAWIEAVASHYHALYVGDGIIRSFGFSVNGIEFINLLLIGCVSVVAAFFAGKRIYIIFFPVLVTMLFLASSRTSIVKLVFAMSAAWALSSRGGKGWAVRLPIALTVLVGLLAFGLSQVSSGGGAAGGAASISTQHQVEGLSHPLDNKKSTAGLHGKFFFGGIKEGFTNPIGSGLGSTGGGGKAGADEGSQDEEGHIGNTEIDLSDSFISLGAIGGLLYLFFIILVMRKAIKFGQTSPKVLGLPLLAILAAMLGGWTAVGQYGMGPLIWFLIGSLTRSRGVRLEGLSAEKSGPVPISV